MEFFYIFLLDMLPWPVLPLSWRLQTSVSVKVKDWWQIRTRWKDFHWQLETLFQKYWQYFFVSIGDLLPKSQWEAHLCSTTEDCKEFGREAFWWAEPLEAFLIQAKNVPERPSFYLNSC